LFGLSRSDENLSSVHGSPRDYRRTDLSLQFIDSLRPFPSLERDNSSQSQVETDLESEVGLVFVNTGAVLGTFGPFYAVARFQMEPETAPALVEHLRPAVTGAV
jgi:hypothetical protein